VKVGYFCTYVPEELIQACGGQAHLLYPKYVSHNDATSYFPTSFCPLAKSLLANLLSERWKDIDFFIFGTGCDAGRRLYDVFTSLRSKVPSYFLEIPAIDTDQAITFYARNLNELAQYLLSIQGIPSIEYTVNLIASLITGYDIKKNFTDLFFKGKEYGDTFIKPIGFSDKRLKNNPEPIPILLIASHLFIHRIINVLEKRGFLVLDNSALGMRRYIFPDISYTVEDDSFMTLSRWYLKNKVPCPGHSPERRLSILNKTIFELDIQGIIYFYPKFCDQSLYDIAFLKKYLTIPLLPIEHDVSFSSLGQWETRIDAFREVLSR